jgi:alpha-D-xyloside xylohydrolase
MRYRLLPYIYAQATDAARRGLPMVRALFVEYPDDPGSWLVEDEYLFGTDMLVAQMFGTGTKGRDVYLPPGTWIDYQTRRSYPGGWHFVESGEIPIVVLVREGAALPHARLAQSTNAIDWTQLELAVFATRAASARGLVALPGDGRLHEVALTRQGNSYTLSNDPLRGKVTWTVRTPAPAPEKPGN